MRWRRASATADPELLDDLKRALVAPTPPIDDAPSLASLHRAVDARESWPGERRRSRWYVPPRLAVPALAGGLVLGGSSVAFAVSGTPLPKPVRVVAHAVGLPVDSPEVAAARSDTAALRSALNREDRSSVESDAQRLRSQLGDLSTDDHHDLGPEPEHLLVRADDLIHSGDGDRGGSTSSSATPASTTTVPRIDGDHSSGETQGVTSTTNHDGGGGGGGDSTTTSSSTTTTTNHDGGGDGGGGSH